MSKIARRIVKTNQDIIGEHCIRNDDDILAVSNEDKKIACISYHEKLLNKGLACDRNSLCNADIVSCVTDLTNKNMSRECISKTKNGKAAKPKCVVSEMVRAAGEASADMTTDLVNQIIVGVIRAEWELSTIVSCYNEKSIS